MLNHLEVTLLEALRDFPDHSELHWPAARARIRRLVQNGHVDLQKVAAVGATERRPGLADRLADLVSA